MQKRQKMNEWEEDPREINRKQTKMKLELERTKDRKREKEKERREQKDLCSHYLTRCVTQ